MHRTMTKNADMIILGFGFAFCAFLIQSLAFTSEFRPDEHKAIVEFVRVIANGTVTPLNEFFTRFALTLFNFGIVAVLVSVRLIDRRTLYFALIWPLTIFLFSKIYWEFFIFPFCLIRFDLRAKHEASLMLLLAILIVLTHESNLGVILLFRSVLFCQKIGFKKLAPIGVAVGGLLIDFTFKVGLAAKLPVIGGLLYRFGYTRDIANPDYTPLETAMVFITSFHFFSLHTGAFWIDSFFSLAVIAIIANSKEVQRAAYEQRWVIAALISTIFFFTSVTHAFQNARYYYFYIVVLAVIVPRRLYVSIATLGLLHVIFRAFAL